jgi:alpha-glucosidase
LGTGQPRWVLGNHDKPRIASRVGLDQARVAAMLLLTLRGTPTLYYGDELGMRDVEIPPDRVQDPFEKNVPGMGFGRDPVRTPMQWSAEPHAGFSKADPWLPLADDYRTTNVEAERADPASLLSFYRRAIALRRREPALAVGSYQFVSSDADLFAYIRRDGRRAFYIALNLGSETVELDGIGDGSVALDTHLTREGEPVHGSIELQAGQGLVISFEKDVAHG